MCEKNKKPQETIELTDDQLEDVAGGSDSGNEASPASDYSELIRPVITRYHEE